VPDAYIDSRKCIRFVTGLGVVAGPFNLIGWFFGIHYNETEGMTRGEAKGKEGAGHANKENTEEIENDLKSLQILYFPRSSRCSQGYFYIW